jgi:hypothetical protein
MTAQYFLHLNTVFELFSYQHWSSVSEYFYLFHYNADRVLLTEYASHYGQSSLLLLMRELVTQCLDISSIRFLSYLFDHASIGSNDLSDEFEWNQHLHIYTHIIHFLSFVVFLNHFKEFACHHFLHLLEFALDLTD